MRLSIPLCLLYPSIAPPPPFAALSPSIPWFYYSLGVTEVSAGVHVYSKQAWQAPHQTEHEKFLCWWETAGYERGKEWEMASGGYDKGNAELGGERRAKAEVWDETEQIRVTVSNKGYDTFSTFTFSSSFPFLFVALFLPSFSPTLHLFLHLSPAFVFHADLKTGAKKKKERKECVHI